MSQMIKTAYGYVSLTEAAICAALEGWLQKNNINNLVQMKNNAARLLRAVHTL